MKTILALGACAVALASGGAHARPFKISESYTASPQLVPGYYACVSGLDFSDFTMEFDVSADGSYTLRGQSGTGTVNMTSEGGIEFRDGPLQSDETAATYAMSTIRVSDGNPVIIVRYDFGDVVTDDYCALVN